MQNPVPVKRKLFLLYGVIWLLLAGFLAAFLSLYLQVDIQTSLTDALVSAIFLSIMYLSLWYVFRYSEDEDVFSRAVIVHSLAGMLLVITLWLFISIYLLGLLFSNNEFYLDVLQQSYVLRFFFGVFAGIIVFLVFSSYNLVRASQEAADRETELKTLIQQTELQALKNQLNPHFIYNSLNSISSLTITSPEKARSMVVYLSEFLRYVLKQDTAHLAALREELNSINLYLKIEKVRFGDKLLFRSEVNEDHLNFRIPSMILQPLVENAIKHGIQKFAEPLAINLTTADTPQGLQIVISNSYDSKFSPFRSEGIGLENIRNRMRLTYGNGKLLRVENDGKVFSAILIFPGQAEENQVDL